MTFDIKVKSSAAAGTLATQGAANTEILTISGDPDNILFNPALTNVANHGRVLDMRCIDTSGRKIHGRRRSHSDERLVTSIQRCPESVSSSIPQRSDRRIDLTSRCSCVAS